MKFGFVALSLLIGLGTLSSAHAQSSNPTIEARLQNLEDKLANQEVLLNNLWNRVGRLERQTPIPPAPPVPRDVKRNCLLIDSGYSKAYLGSGSTKLDAEFNARQSCQKDVNAVYCNGPVKCDSTADNATANGAVCVITDSGYSKAYRGTGSTPVEAEALAKQACQSAVNAIYCGNVTARCELR